MFAEHVEVNNYLSGNHRVKSRQLRELNKPINIPAYNCMV